MNFDFLKGLCGLGCVYKNCSNAEKLALTMPVQSMFTARKSAEQLAKFIYLAAHNEQMESMNFIDILNDPVVRDFIHNQKVLSAFHYIRKSGNHAVHSDDDETSEDSVSLLRNLHYVAGETACMLGLVKSYPKFDKRIDPFPEAEFIPIDDVDDIARKMFLEYVEKYNAQAERDSYYQHNIDNLLKDFESMISPIHFVPGDVDLNEVLEFKNKPANASSLKPIQNYYGFLAMRAIRKIRDELYGELEERDLEFTGELTIYGENGYTTSDLGEFIYGILQDLPSAEGFKIVTKYRGPSIAPWFEVNQKARKEEFSSEIAEIGKTENLTYMIYEFLHNHGEGWIGKFENGKWIKIEEQYTADILDKDFGKNWWCWNLDLNVDFDCKNHPNIVDALHDCVRKYIPEDQMEYCEESWNDGNFGVLCNSIQWCPRKLRTVQDFLNEVNEILKPIANECDGCGRGNWFITEPPFAIATWDWTDQRFAIKGSMF